MDVTSIQRLNHLSWISLNAWPAKAECQKTAIVENAPDYYFRHNKTVNDMFKNLKE